MGYYTKFKLHMNHMPEGHTVHNSEDEFMRIKLELEAITSYQFHEHRTTPHVLDLDEAKWYDHGENMKALSKKWPKILFQLDGDGEESGDVWREYWLDGKVQAAKQKSWTPPDFDPKKLV